MTTDRSVSVKKGILLVAFGSRTPHALTAYRQVEQMVQTVFPDIPIRWSFSLVSAVCVSVSGIIGFVGLLVPHIMRTLTGPDNQRLILVSIFAGAILLLGADTLTRAVLPHEIPIGVLTALTGGPFFCYIYRKRQTGGTHDD